MIVVSYPRDWFKNKGEIKKGDIVIFKTKEEIEKENK